MDKREFWKEAVTNGFEDFIETIPLILSRQDIGECFREALNFFRDRDEIEPQKGLSDVKEEWHESGDGRQNG